MKLILLIFVMAAVCLLPAAAAGTEAASTSEISANAPVTAVDLSAVPTGEVFCLEQPGTYRLTGTLSGQLAVDTDGAVTLILAGVSVSGQECLLLKGDGAVTLRTETGTVNTLTDGASAADSHASAVIFSKCPLTIDGDGVLIVTAGANNGIQCKRGLTVSGGTLQLSAANNGIKTDGNLSVSGGSIALTCGGDGLAADTSRLTSGDITVSGGSVVIDAQGRGLDAEGDVSVTDGTVNICSFEDGIRGTETVRLSGGETSVTVSAPQPETEDTKPVTGDGIQGGIVTLSGGNVLVNASDEGIQADDLLTVSGGTLVLTAGGDALECLTGITVSGGSLDITTGEGAGQAINRSDSGGFGGPGGWGGGSGKYTMPAESMKGFKSDGDIAFTGGTVVLNCVDDAVHAGGNVTVSRTDMTVSSNDDAIHADNNITIDSGRILVLDCFEGIEGKLITVNGGDIDVFSVNDGINATSGSGGWGSPWGSSDCAFVMNGGSVDIYITGTTSNLGDGVDSNGSLVVNGGWLSSSTVGGTMENGLDSGGSFVVTGGIVASGGNSGMQESASSSSTQCTAVLKISGGYVPAGTECIITNSDGNEVMRWTPYNGCNCLIFSHPDFVIGGTYTLTAGSIVMDFTFDSVSYSNSSGRGWGRF